MSISVECPECQATYNVKDELAGKKIRCKKCEGVIRIPADEFDFGADEFDDEEEEEAPRVVKKSKSKTTKKRTSRRSGGGMPVAIIIAIICLVMMIGFTLVNMFGTLSGENEFAQNQARKSGAIMGDLVRLIIQIAVLVGVARGSSGIRTPAIALGVIFIIFIGGFGIIGALNRPDGGLLAAILAFAVSLRIVFVICLAVSADYFPD